MEPTQDINTFIVEKTLEYTEYENTDGKKWRVFGKCISCGLCESKPDIIPSTVHELNRVIHPDGTETSYTRTLVWSTEPGVAGACIEEGFEYRLDIPMTPDFINNVEGCTLSGTYLDGN